MSHEPPFGLPVHPEIGGSAPLSAVTAMSETDPAPRDGTTHEVDPGGRRSLTQMSSERHLLLLRRVADKDREAFEELYHQYYRRLFQYVLKITRRIDLVEEVVNDVLLTVWESAARFDERSRPSTWIFGIAYRKSLKALQKAARHSSEELPESLLDEGVHYESPDRVAARKQLRRRLDLALGQLSAEHRAVVELTYYYECSCAEIAEIVGCPVNTVKTRMFHARKRLRQLLPDLGVGSLEVN